MGCNCNKFSKSFIYILMLCLSNSCFIYKDETIKIEKEINFEFPKISEIKKEEISQKLKDKSVAYFWGVSEDIYPYFSNHKFENPITYERPANNFVLKVDYFFDKKEDVKLKFYEWNYNEKVETPREIFTDKFEEIKNFLSEKIGNPIFVNYEDLERSKEGTVRDDVKWRSKT